MHVGERKIITWRAGEFTLTPPQHFSPPVSGSGSRLFLFIAVQIPDNGIRISDLGEVTFSKAEDPANAECLVTLCVVSSFLSLELDAHYKHLASSENYYTYLVEFNSDKNLDALNSAMGDKPLPYSWVKENLLDVGRIRQPSNPVFF